ANTMAGDRQVCYRILVIWKYSPDDASNVSVPRRTKTKYQVDAPNAKQHRY
ncbi:putative sulfite reductase [NADPH] hemoprotein beta-component, partial [Vibrio parahaemolyticus VPTS-2010_2]